MGSDRFGLVEAEVDRVKLKTKEKSLAEHDGVLLGGSGTALASRLPSRSFCFSSNFVPCNSVDLIQHDQILTLA